MFQRDPHNGGTLSTTAPSQPVVAAWTLETEDALTAQPVVRNGTVFQVGTDSNVYALAARSGETEWVVGTNGPLGRTPAVGNGILYVPTPRNRFLALSVGTGSGQWARGLDYLDEPLSAVTLTGDTALVSENGSPGNTVYSLDAATGDGQWQVDIQDAFHIRVPVVTDQRLFVGYTREDKEWLQARSRSDRSRQWEVNLGGGSTSISPNQPSSPATYADIDGGTVFVGTRGGKAVSLDAATGETNWRFTNMGDVRTAPTYAESTLYVASEDPALHAIDPSIGTRQWQVTLDGPPTSPTVADGMVFVGTGAGTVYGFDAQSNEQRWRFETDGGIVAPPVPFDDTVYVASTDGTLYALREEGAISPGDVTGDGAPAQDLDEDGLYEDVNGDGAFTIVDVQALFANLDSDVVQENAEKFDFNGDGEVDVTDVQALYARLNR